MMRFIVLLSLALSTQALRDVPLGECYDCEVTCFEDCALKYDREVLQMDLIQVGEKPEKENRTMKLTDEYSECLQEDKCPCRAAAAANKTKVADKSKALQLMAADKKKGKCAVGEMSCSTKCGQKVVAKDIAKLTKGANQTASFLQKKDFPLHAVKINVFKKGAMTLDQCLKFCLAATCGCDDAPVNQAKAIKQNAKIKGVTDTPKSPQYRPAKIEECAKGMMGKKVASDLYIKLGGGPTDYKEVCSKDFLSAILGPSGDVSGMTKKCKSGASDDAKYGCSWNEEKGKCVVGFSPILVCLKKYFNDPTF